MVYKLFEKNLGGSGITTLTNQITQNEQLVEKLHKRIIRKF